jgi:hypothetical protein
MRRVLGTAYDSAVDMIQSMENNDSSRSLTQTRLPVAARALLIGPQVTEEHHDQEGSKSLTKDTLEELVAVQELLDDKVR